MGGQGPSGEMEAEGRAEDVSRRTSELDRRREIRTLRGLTWRCVRCVGCVSEDSSSRLEGNEEMVGGEGASAQEPAAHQSPSSTCWALAQPHLRRKVAIVESALA